MPLTASNFNVENATQADTNSLNAALAYLGTSSDGATTMQSAANEQANIIIVHDGGDKYDSNTNTATKSVKTC